MVLHDENTQDEAGADLLTSKFTHIAELHRQNVADVVFKIIIRSGIWNLNYWDKYFSSNSISYLQNIRAVNGMMRGELWSNISENYELKGFFKKIEYSNFSDSMVLSHIFWAAICVEVFDYLERGKTKLVLMKAFAEIPLEIETSRWRSSSILNACNRYRVERSDVVQH